MEIMLVSKWELNKIDTLEVEAPFPRSHRHRDDLIPKCGVRQSNNNVRGGLHDLLLAHVHSEMIYFARCSAKPSKYKLLERQYIHCNFRSVSMNIQD